MSWCPFLNKECIGEKCKVALNGQWCSLRSIASNLAEINKKLTTEAIPLLEQIKRILEEA